MSPAEFLLLGLLATVLFGGTVGSVAYREHKNRISAKRKELLEKGDLNKQEEEIKKELHCTECDKTVSPECGDIYADHRWWCVSCWKQYR